MNEYLLTAAISSGVAWIVAKLAFKQAVEDAIKETVSRMYASIDSIHKEISNLKHDFQNDYVMSRYCTMQHENVSAMNKAINAKLDILIADRGKDV